MSSKTNGIRRRPHDRRRSSLPNLKLVPLTMAERRLLARQKRKEEEEAAKLRAQKAAEEKKLAAKQRRQAAKAKDKKQRARYSIRGGMVHCKYCGDLIAEIEFDDHFVSHPTHIRERIWLGNAENSKDLGFIKKYGITHILNCTREIDLPKDISKKIKSFKRIAIQDKNHETISGLINDSNSFIEKALGDSKNNKIFIHCREGRSRSVSFLCAYLMWKEELSFYAALSDVRSKRHIVLPNNKFYSELEKFDKELIADRAKFGAPSKAFKLKKLKKVSANKVGVPLLVTDDIKNGDDEEDGNEEEDVFESMSPLTPSSGNVGHSRGRSSSLSQIGRSSTYDSERRNKGKGRRLSPVKGSPVGKRKGAGVNGWSDVIYDGKGKDGKKKKKGSKKTGNKGKKKKDEDLNVEEALDVTDIFPSNGDKNGKKKKKKSLEKKKEKNGVKKKKAKKSKE